MFLSLLISRVNIIYHPNWNAFESEGEHSIIMTEQKANIGIVLGKLAYMNT